MNKSCKVLVKPVPSRHSSLKRIEPGKKAFNFPTAAIAPQRATILRGFTFSIAPVWCDHLNPLGSKGVIERITVIGTIPNNSSGLSRRELNIVCKRKRRVVRTTDSNHAMPVAPNLLNRNFAPEERNRVWASDITYIPTRQGWVYLAGIKDLYSRETIGFSLAKRMDTSLVLDALAKAVYIHCPPVGLEFFLIGIAAILATTIRMQDKGDFMRASRIRVHGEWKTRSVCNNHELRTFAPLGLSHFCAPFLPPRTCHQ